jgi:hypothetical protein
LDRIVVALFSSHRQKPVSTAETGFRLLPV